MYNIRMAFLVDQAEITCIELIKHSQWLVRGEGENSFSLAVQVVSLTMDIASY